MPTRLLEVYLLPAIPRISAHPVARKPCDQTCYHFVQKPAQNSRNPGV